MSPSSRPAVASNSLPFARGEDARGDASRRDLLAALAAMVPADDAEARDIARVAELLASEPACFSRTTFAPGHITGSAYIVDEAGRLLLHHHRRLDRWLQMGGHDEGELDAFATGLREAREESGLEDLEVLGPRIVDVDVHAIPASAKEPAHLHHDVRTVLLTRSPHAIAFDVAESKALRFFSLEEATERLGDASAGRVIEKIRRLLAERAP